MLALIVGGVELQRAVERELAPHGFSVARVADLSGADVATREGHCALLIVDWSMAGAAATCRALADWPQCAETALVVATDERAPERLAAVFAAGACDAIALPVDRERLVARALAARQARPSGVARGLYRPVFERNPIAMAVIDDETLRFLAVSDGAIRQYGWSREEFLSLTLRDIRPAEVVPALDAAIESGDPSFLLTTTHRRKDGSEFTSQGIIQRVTVGGRRVRFAVSRDVTEEVRIAEAHRRSLAAYQSLVERSADGVFTHLANFGVAYANPAFVAFLGYSSASEIVGRSVLDFVHPDDRDTVRTRVRGIFETGQPSPPRAIRMLGRDGAIRWAETRGILVSYDERQPAVTVIARDLTERRKAEETLRLSEQRFSRLFQANPAGISITRMSDRRFVDVNDRFVEMTGFSRAEVVGKTGAEVGLWYDPDIREILYEALGRSGRVRDVEVRFRRKTGERVDGLLSTEIVEVGGERCLLALAIDISERKCVFRPS